ncbi:MAG: OmpA family protein [Alphaproteobacteria bacterium]|nr:OmpA family protein [Alphaproteobacteria bacterium]
MSDEEALEPLILKKKLKGADGGHGGAWKVAYADFVTAMMAFFLLLWLLNATTSDQKQGLSFYFQPKTVTSGDESGSGGLLGGLAVGAIGNLRSAGSPPSVTIPIPSAGGPKERKGKDEAALTSKDPNPDSTNFEARKREEEEDAFQKAKADLRLAVEQTDQLRNFQDSLLIDQTPEGLRIQLIDREKATMFEPGSAVFTPYFKALLQIITRVVARFPNPVSISGHTDSAPLPLDAPYTNWELSGDRANSARRTMVGAGLPTDRIANVTGRADTEHLFPKEPNASSNRRISILMIRMADKVNAGADGSEQREKGSSK